MPGLTVENVELKALGVCRLEKEWIWSEKGMVWTIVGGISIRKLPSPSPHPEPCAGSYWCISFGQTRVKASLACLYQEDGAYAPVFTCISRRFPQEIEGVGASCMPRSNTGFRQVCRKTPLPRSPARAHM